MAIPPLPRFAYHQFLVGSATVILHMVLHGHVCFPSSVHNQIGWVMGKNLISSNSSMQEGIFLYKED
eukprot:scaffold46847_cov221-Amphora_coffeaeformis.AAC.2